MAQIGYKQIGPKASAVKAVPFILAIAATQKDSD
jgi:hypothetical protein